MAQNITPDNARSIINSYSERLPVLLPHVFEKLVDPDCTETFLYNYSVCYRAIGPITSTAQLFSPPGCYKAKIRARQKARWAIEARLVWRSYSGSRHRENNSKSDSMPSYNKILLAGCILCTRLYVAYDQNREYR